MKRFLASALREAAQLGAISVSLNASAFLKSVQYSPDELALIEEMIRGQSDNDVWRDLRRPIISASKFYAVCARMRSIEKDSSASVETLLEDMTSSKEISNTATDWGLRKERKARTMYRTIERKKHRKLEVDELGLTISSDRPYLGCSVDGIVRCGCHETRLLEIKCPYALRGIHPREAALQRGCKVGDDGELYLTQGSQYYHQVQCQMGVMNIQRCDFLFYTTKMNA